MTTRLGRLSTESEPLFGSSSSRIAHAFTNWGRLLYSRQPDGVAPISGAHLSAGRWGVDSLLFATDAGAVPSGC